MDQETNQTIGEKLMTQVEEFNSEMSGTVRRGRDAEFPFRIGDLAREFDVTLRTLRFYEDKRLLRPKRQGTTRLYSELDRAKLKLILMGKKVGFALSEIKQLLALYDFEGSEYTDLPAVKEMFASQMMALKQQQKDVEGALHELEVGIADVEKQMQGTS